MDSSNQKVFAKIQPTEKFEPENTVKKKLRLGSLAFTAPLPKINNKSDSKKNETGIFGVNKYNWNSPKLSDFEIQIDWSTIMENDTMNKILQFASTNITNWKLLACMIVEQVRNEKLNIQEAAKVCTFLEKSEKGFFPDHNKKADTIINIFNQSILQELQKSFEEYFSRKFVETSGLRYHKERRMHTQDIRFIGSLYVEHFIGDEIKNTLTKFLLKKFLKEYSFYLDSYEKDSTKNHYEDTLKNTIIFYEVIRECLDDTELSRLERQKEISTFGYCLKQVQNGTYLENYAQDISGKGFNTQDISEILEIIRETIYSLSEETLILIEKFLLHEEERGSDHYSGSDIDRTEMLEEDFKEIETEAQSPKKDNKGVESNNTPKIVTLQAEIKTNNTSSEEVEAMLKKIYRRIPENKELDIEKAKADVIKIAIGFGGVNVLRAFYRTFYDDKAEVVKSRIFIPNRLLERKYITNEEFLKEFEEAIIQLSGIAHKHPNINAAFAAIFLRHCQEIGDLSPLDSINLPENGYIKYDPLCIFYQKFFIALLEALKSEFPGLYSKDKEDTLRQVGRRINIDKVKSEGLIFEMMKAQQRAVARRAYDDHFQVKQNLSDQKKTKNNLNLEKEQMETESRKSENIKELMNSSSLKDEEISKSQTNQTAEEVKTEFDRHSKDSVNNLSDKPSANDSANKRINCEETCKELEDIYRNFDRDRLQDHKILGSEVKLTARKSGGKDLLQCFFKTFYIGKSETMEKRLIIPHLLLELKLVSNQDFLNEFQKAMRRISEIVDDYPGLDIYLATIFFNYCKFMGDLSPLDNISFENELYQSNDADHIFIFYQNFLEAFYEILKNDTEFKAKTDPACLKQFHRKINARLGYDDNEEEDDAKVKPSESEEKLSEDEERIVFVKPGQRWSPEMTKKSAIRFYLNILTVRNFEIIKKEILKLASTGADDCKLVAELIINNAQTQHSLTKIYCRLSEYLAQSQNLYFNGEQKNQFKCEIVSLVQNSLDNYPTGFSSKLIGELFLANFFPSSTIHTITTILLRNFLNSYLEYNKSPKKLLRRGHEDSLKDLAKLYEIIGKDVQHKEGAIPYNSKESYELDQNAEKVIEAIRSTTIRNTFPQFSKLKFSLEGIFKIFDSIRNLTNLSPRLRYLIEDLIETKQKKWTIKGTINEELTRIYIVLDESYFNKPENFHEEILKLAKEFSGKKVLYSYYKTFFDGKKKSVQRRMFIPSLLISKKMVTQEEFLNEFKFSIQKTVEFACDYPGLENYFATIILNYSSEVGDLSCLPKILLTQEAFNKDHALKFYQSFAISLLRLINDNNPSLIIQGSIEDLTKFTRTLKLNIFTLDFMHNFVKRRLAEIITLNDFELIKESFLEIASSSLTNCEEVVKAILADVSKQGDFSTHIMLYEFLERARKLYFNDTINSQERRKNYFKMQFLYHIQYVFEDKQLNSDQRKNYDDAFDFTENGLKLLRLVRFIAELYHKKLLMGGIIYNLTASLLKRFLQEYAANKDGFEKSESLPYEETLEALTELYSRTAQSLKEKEELKGVDKTKSESALAKFRECLNLAITKSKLEENEIMIRGEEMSMECFLSIFETLLPQLQLSKRLESLMRNLLCMNNRG